MISREDDEVQRSSYKGKTSSNLEVWLLDVCRQALGDPSLDFDDHFNADSLQFARLAVFLQTEAHAAASVGISLSCVTSILAIRVRDLITKDSVSALAEWLDAQDVQKLVGEATKDLSCSYSCPCRETRRPRRGRPTSTVSSPTTSSEVEHEGGHGGVGGEQVVPHTYHRYGFTCLQLGLLLVSHIVRFWPLIAFVVFVPTPLIFVMEVMMGLFRMLFALPAPTTFAGCCALVACLASQVGFLLY